MNLLVNWGLVDVLNLDIEDIDTVSIAKALSRIRRWTGNFNSLSVAQHAVIVSAVVEKRGGSLRQQLAALHHDDAEAFVGDVPSPIKKECETFLEIEARVNDVINEAFDIDVDDDIVRDADHTVAAKEMEFHCKMNPMTPRLMVNLRSDKRDVYISPDNLMPWEEEKALSRYLTRHEKLTRALIMQDNLVKELPPAKGDDTCLN